MKSGWTRTLLLVFIGAVGVYGLIYADVVSRAKESYAEAEKYMDWHQHPEKKKEFFEQKFASDKAELDRRLSKKELSDEDYRRKMEALEFDKQFVVGESSLKYAYQWYKDTYELFSPPESKWVKLARAKAPQALELWKQELREQKIPFEDIQLE